MDAVLFLLAGTLVSVPCCIVVPRLLARAGFLDIPGERSSHVRPTPKGGGVGMVLAFIWAAIFTGIPMYFWLPPAALAGLSFVNDLRGMAPKVRLLAHVTAAAVVLAGAWWSGAVAWSGWLLLPAVVFVAATANCYNFMDGINGIAGISGIVAFSCLIVSGSMESVPFPLLLPTVALIGGLIGFLPFNLPRARLFMGDAGSISLGFLFAVGVCVLARSWTEFFVLASFLYPFYADEAVTMMERIWRRESLVQPHRRHLYQFLANELGFAHWKVSAAYAALQIAIAALAVMAGRHGLPALLSLLFALLAVWMVVHLGLKYRFSMRHEGT